MKCEHCGHGLIKTDRREEMTELDDDATEGQIADFLLLNFQGIMVPGALVLSSITVHDVI